MNLPQSSSSLSQQSTSGIVQNYRKALPKRPGKVGSGLPGVPPCPWDMGLGAGDPWHGQVVLGPYYPLYYFSGSFSILGLWLVEAETQPSSEKWGCWGSTYGWSHWVRVPAPPCCFLAWMHSVTSSESHGIADCCWKKPPLTDRGNTLG